MAARNPSPIVRAFAVRRDRITRAEADKLLRRVCDHQRQFIIGGSIGLEMIYDFAGHAYTLFGARCGRRFVVAAVDDMLCAT